MIRVTGLVVLVSRRGGSRAGWCAAGEHLALDFPQLPAEGSAHPQFAQLGTEAPDIPPDLGSEAVCRARCRGLVQCLAAVREPPASVRGTPSRGHPVNQRQANLPEARRHRSSALLVISQVSAPSLVGFSWQ